METLLLRLEDSDLEHLDFAGSEDLTLLLVDSEGLDSSFARLSWRWAGC